MGQGPARCGRTTSAATGSRSTSPATLGFNADFEEVFGDLDTKLLLRHGAAGARAAAALIYRSPLIALIPLVVVGVRLHRRAAGLIYLYAEVGRDGQPTTSTSDPRGADVRRRAPTTACCSCRDTARSCDAHEDKHEAMARALRRAGPGDPRQRPDRRADDARAAASPTPASIALARPGRRRSASPCVLLAGLTLLPALLTIAGRRGFWPRRHDWSPTGPRAAGEERAGIWRRIGDTRPQAARARARRVTRRAVRRRRARAARLQGGLQRSTNFFKKPTESIDGFDGACEQAFPAGALVPDHGARRARATGR